MEVRVREEDGLAFQYPERITGRALDGWSPRSYMGLRGGCIKGGEERGMNVEVEGWGKVSRGSIVSRMPCGCRGRGGTR